MSDNTTKEAAKKALLKYPFLRDLDGKEVNGTRAWLLMCQQIDWKYLENGEPVSQAITRLLRTAMLEHPGLFDELPSPDGILKRLREVKDEMEKQGLLQPTL